jgi:hypothetical protein
MLEQDRITNELLDIAYNVDSFTTSDLQGAIEVQVKKAMRLGIDLKEKLYINN